MGLINTDGLFVLGPGSEWFWSAAQFLVVAVTLIGLYRQLRQQNAANAVQRMELLQGQWDGERLIHARLLVALWRKRGEDLTASGYEAQVAVATVANFFENLADLLEAGYLTWREIEYTWATTLPGYWAMCEPAIRAERGRVSAGVYQGFERLAGRAIASARARGDDWSVGEADVPSVVDEQIGRNTMRLRVLRDIRDGVIPAAADPQVVPAP